jgi:hypothetical protein
MQVIKQNVRVDGKVYTATLIDGQCVSISGSRHAVCTWGWRSGKDKVFTEVFFELTMSGRIAKKVLKALQASEEK